MNPVPDGVLRVLVLGDVCGEPGRKAVEQELPNLKRRTGAGFVIANSENAAGGYGVTPTIADGLLKAGVDCLTTGDHVYDRKEVWEYLGIQSQILRPLNFPPQAPGRGWAIYDWPPASAEEKQAAAAPPVRIAVVNLQGRVFMKPLDCPFRKALLALDEIRRETALVFVDFHAEATAEKQAMGWFLDGRVSAVLGSHTHVQTADETILSGETAFICDLGMCGSFDSVLGMNKDQSLRRMVEQVLVRLNPASGDVRLNGVWIDVGQSSGRAFAIGRLSEPVTLSGNQSPVG